MMPALALAGDGVNRECNMQVRGYECTTPALVPFVSLVFGPFIEPFGFEPSRNQCSMCPPIHQYHF